jgi:hypothetical protein
MKMLFVLDEDLLVVDGKAFTATCRVRNELNGLRADHEVVHNTPADGSPGSPYQPRRMPTGWWQVRTPIRVNPADFMTYSSYKIPTTAKRIVALWDTVNGRYTKQTDRTSVDGFYHLHASPGYLTTHGCIRLDSDADDIEIAKAVKQAIGKGDKIWLEVVATR